MTTRDDDIDGIDFAPMPELRDLQPLTDAEAEALGFPFNVPWSADEIDWALARPVPEWVRRLRERIAAAPHHRAGGGAGE